MTFRSCHKSSLRMCLIMTQFLFISKNSEKVVYIHTTAKRSFFLERAVIEAPLQLNSKQGFISKPRHTNESFRDNTFSVREVLASNLASKAGYPKSFLGITRFPLVNSDLGIKLGHGHFLPRFLFIQSLDAT
jgi:hypothetical protein